MNFFNWLAQYAVLGQDLLDAFNYVKQRFQDGLMDLGRYGIAPNPWGGSLGITQSSPPGMTIAIGTGRAYTKDGQRIVIDSAVTQQNVMVDEDGNAIALPTAGNERWISVFLKPAVVTSDNRVTRDAVTFPIRSVQSFAVGVEAGAIAGSGLGVKPALRTDAVLLCDILLVSTTVQITNAATPSAPVAGEINLLRTEYMETVTPSLGAAIVKAMAYLQVRQNLGNSIVSADGSRIYADLVPKAFFSVKWDGAAHVVANKCNISAYGNHLNSQVTLTLPTGLFNSADDILVLITPQVTSLSIALEEILCSYQIASATQVTVQVFGPKSGGVYPSTMQANVGYSVMIFGRPSI